MIYSLVTCFLLAAPAQPAAPPGQVEWKRANIGHATVVTSPAVNPHARQASEELQRIADRLDALRTLVPHVIWRRLTWTPRIIQIEAYGDAAIMANVALLALRDLLPGWRSAGSGVRQTRALGDHIWHVRGLFSRPTLGKPKFKRRKPSR